MAGQIPKDLRPLWLTNKLNKMEQEPGFQEMRTLEKVIVHIPDFIERVNRSPPIIQIIQNFSVPCR